jgi:nucleotide-binding universal stress UspA family protein
LRVDVEPATLILERMKHEGGDVTGTIVCGVDGSRDSRAALDIAAGLAERLGSRLVLAHVVDYVRTPYAGAGPFGAIAPRTDLAAHDEDHEEAAERLLGELALEAGLERAERRVVIGHPAERIAELADDEGADLIVVGSRGRGAFRAAFLGSVSNSLVGVARCPVLIVPPGVSDG